MTVGKAIELADKLRANNGFDRELKILWLRQADAGLRKSVVEKSDTDAFDAVGADVLYDREEEMLRQDAELMLPQPYDDYYPHYLSAQMDLAPRRDRPVRQRDAGGEQLPRGICHLVPPALPAENGHEMEVLKWRCRAYTAFRPGGAT